MSSISPVPSPDDDEIIVDVLPPARRRRHLRVTRRGTFAAGLVAGIAGTIALAVWAATATADPTRLDSPEPTPGGASAALPLFETPASLRDAGYPDVALIGHCRAEDAGADGYITDACVWDARLRGDGIGQSFVVWPDAFGAVNRAVLTEARS